MKTLTQLGKFLRKLRIDKLANQAVVAEAIGVSVSFYSAIESGRKPMPDKILNDLIRYFALSEAQEKELKRLVDESKTEIRIDMEGLDSETRQLVACFARNFNDLNEETVTQIEQLLKHRKL